MLFNQTIKNLNRLRQIIQVLVKYGFEDVVTSTTLRNLVPASRQLSWSRQNRPVFAYSRYERIRMALEELGPTYIKFAQVLSNRPDVLPEALISEFVKLQSDVPPIPFATVKDTLERELGQKVETLFQYLLEKPLGSASIGQVHRGRLISGEEVVVKVQRPRVRPTVETDIAILKEVAMRAESYLERNGISSVMDILETLEKTMQRELDYRNEVRNIRQFRELYKDRKDFYVPKAYPEFSTEKVLVQEYADGCKITDQVQMARWGLIPADIASRGMHIYLSQIFETGLFHADPHPGNIILRENGVICLIDFGMVGRMNDSDRFAFAGIFIGMAQQNPRKMAANLIRLTTEHEVNDRQRLEQDLSRLIEDFSGLEIEDGNIAALGIRLQKIIYDYRMKMPGSVFLILRALAILEGIGKQLHPHLNAYAEVAPYGRRLIQEQFSPGNLVNEFSWRLSNLDELLSALPLEVLDILRQVRKGELKFETHSADRDLNLRRMDAMVSRLVLAVLIGFLLMASAIVLHAPSAAQQTALWGIPVFSFVAWVLAAMLSLALMFRSWRSGR
ncbi:MAG: phosphotransferase [Bacteroidetes bacterium]|nr:phosphotransferase [Bacteroidota bacterium]